MISTFGGAGGAATAVYKRIASWISVKREQPYSLVMSWLRCSISFSLLRSAITCLCGARSIPGSPVVIGALDLTTSESQVFPLH